MNKGKIVIFWLVLVMSLGAMQARDGSNFNAGVYFNMGFPAAEFKDNIDHVGLGISAMFSLKLFKSPIYAGVDLSFLTYGSETRYDYLPSVPNYEFEITTSNNIGNAFAFLRYKVIESGRIQPYVDGLIGLNYLWTANEIQGEDDDESSSTTEYDDTAFAYGVGGGVMIELVRIVDKAGKSSSDLLLDFRFRYIWGGKAEYMKEGSIYYEDNDLVYEVYESKTPFFSFQTGITWTF